MLQAMCSWDDSLTHNAVEVYISRLRSKLQHAGIRIRTVRGFGYMVEDPDTAGARAAAPAGGQGMR
jgi:two-component system, OmpR family, response regulator